MARLTTTGQAVLAAAAVALSAATGWGQAERHEAEDGDEARVIRAQPLEGRASQGRSSRVREVFERQEGGEVRRLKEGGPAERVRGPEEGPRPAPAAPVTVQYVPYGGQYVPVSMLPPGTYVPPAGPQPVTIVHRDADGSVIERRELPSPRSSAVVPQRWTSVPYVQPGLAVYPATPVVYYRPGVMLLPVQSYMAAGWSGGGTYVRVQQGWFDGYRPVYGWPACAPAVSPSCPPPSGSGVDIRVRARF